MTDPETSRAFHLLGVPFNSAARSDGVARAPDALRRAGVIGALEAREVTVLDAGNVVVDAPPPARDPVSRITAPQALVEMIRRTRAAIGAILGANGVPVVIGGDCPVLIGCLAALRAAHVQPGVLFIDGHEDAWPPDSSPTGEAADMELGFLLGRTLHRLPPELVREIPHVEPERIVALGPRDSHELATAGVPSVGDDVQIIGPDRIANDPAGVGRASAQHVAVAGSWWLHVDLDVLSSESLAAVDYPQPGGLGWSELTDLTTSAVRVGGLLGLDVTIYNPDLDPERSGAERIVRYLVETIATINEDR